MALGGEIMRSEMSVARVLAKLEARAAVHREQQAFHAQKEAHHREQREQHEAELTKVNANLEAFRSAATTAVGLATQPAVETPTSTSLDIESEYGRLGQPDDPSRGRESAHRRRAFRWGDIADEANK
jgi:hypothetical protein